MMIIRTSLGAPVWNSNFDFEPVCWLWDFSLDFDFVLPLKQTWYYTENQNEITAKNKNINKQAWGRQCETPTFTLNLYVDFETST